MAFAGLLKHLCEMTEVSNACALILLTFYISFLMILEWLYSPERTFLPVARHHHLGRCLVFSAVTGINCSLLGAEFSLLTWPALFVLQGLPQSCALTKLFFRGKDGRLLLPGSNSGSWGNPNMSFLHRRNKFLWLFGIRKVIWGMVFKTHLLLLLLWLPSNTGWV